MEIEFPPKNHFLVLQQKVLHLCNYCDAKNSAFVFTWVSMFHLDVHDYELSVSYVELLLHIIYFIGWVEHLKAFRGIISNGCSPPDKMGWGEADSGNDKKKSKKNLPFQMVTHYYSFWGCRDWLLKGHPGSELPYPIKTWLKSAVVWGFSVKYHPEGIKLSYQLVSTAHNTVGRLLSDHRCEFRLEDLRFKVCQGVDYVSSPGGLTALSEIPCSRVKMSRRSQWLRHPSLRSDEVLQTL